MSYQFSNRLVRLIGYGFFVVLGVLSLVYYKERTLFTDAAFHIFHIIWKDTFLIAHNRAGNVLIQILPWLAVKSHLPLKVVLMAYSFNYVLFFAVGYHLLVRWLKNDYLGWILIFFLTLLSLDSFYYIQSGLYQGVTVILLVFGMILKHPNMDKRWMYITLPLLLLLLANYHKSMLVLFPFFWVFFMLHRPAFLKNWKYWLLYPLMLLFNFILSKLLYSWYDNYKMEGFWKTVEEYFPNFWEIPSLYTFLEQSMAYYYVYPILLLAVVVGYVIRRRWLPPLFILTFSAAYLILTAYTAPENPYRFYAELYYLPLSLFVCTPLLFDLLPRREWLTRWLPLLFAGVLIWRLAVTLNNASTFQQRFDWIEQTLDKAQKNYGGTRFYTFGENVPTTDTLLMNWGVPYESLMYNALKHPDSSRTLYIHEDFFQLEKHIFNRDSFITPFDKFSMEELPAHYFRLGEGGYEEVDR